MKKMAASGSSGVFVKFAVAVWRQVAVAAIVMSLGVAGCATLPGSGLSKDAPPEAKVAAVTKRAEARWESLMKGDTRAAYQYLSPASRAVTPLERYQAKMKTASFRSIKIDQASCEAETCRLRFWLTFDHRMMQGVVIPIEETWVIEDGQAWFVYRE